ncbi:hypothetical protein EDM00_05205 [Ornithobacterium rhinotracheale]|uniref:hypothetical protein n=1 Tax=Ornithobacterium rhinotracheale TaxID=28251 RepID=UPI00129D095B|nr:hypothetical protein [Ornithobacterium rhinotracheale]MRI63386.1 hypothetical protein [Ornithobacterium rhinotracheale]
MKLIKNLNQLKSGAFYKENGNYYKFTGVNSFGQYEAISFCLDEMEEKYLDLETPWFDVVVKDQGVEEISEKEFLNAFKKFHKLKKAELKIERETLKIAKEKLLK